MESITQFITSPTFVSVIALSAFILSILSFIWTKKSTKISQQALEESIRNNISSKESEIEHQRYNLLKAMCEEFSLLEKQLTLLGTLQSDFEASNDIIKINMGDSRKLFTETLPLVEKYKKDIELAHLDACTWNKENGVSQLLTLKAAQDVAMVHTQNFVECNDILIANFRKKLLTTQQSYIDTEKVNVRLI